MTKVHVLQIMLAFIAIGIAVFLLPKPTPSANISSDNHRTCNSFTIQHDAQIWSDTHNNILDRDHDGVACESLK